MTIDMLLLSVICAAGYLGYRIIAHAPRERRVFGYMLAANCGLALVAFLRRLQGERTEHWELLSFLSVLLGVLLLAVPAVLNALAGFAMARGYLRLARGCVSLKDVLQPQMGGKEQKEALDALIAVRSGQQDAFLRSLHEQRKNTKLDEFEKWRINERILYMQLASHRWQPAVEQFEGMARYSSQGGLPIGPQMTVEMIRAYCEVGNLEAASQLYIALAQSPFAESPALRPWTARSEMLILAFAGRPTAVTHYFRSGVMGTTPEANQHYWTGVAREQAGDVSGAKKDLGMAVALAKGDAVDIAQARLDSISHAPAEEIPQAVAELADRLTEKAKEFPHQPVGARKDIRSRESVVLGLIIAANVLVEVGVRILLGSTSDPGVLLLAGANEQSAVHAGDWWRLVSYQFLHAGVLHLVFNMIALWALGRIVVAAFSQSTMLVIYLLGGVGGGVASLMWSKAGVSVGASGAVFALLGAAILIAWERRHRGGSHFLNALVFILVAQIVIGILLPQIDQAAHVGGGLTGAFLGFCFTRVGALRKHVSLWLAIVCVLGAAFAGWKALRHDYRDTLKRLPWVDEVSEGVHLSLPKVWRGPSGIFNMELGVAREGAPDDVLKQLTIELLQEDENVEFLEMGTFLPPIERVTSKEYVVRFKPRDDGVYQRLFLFTKEIPGKEESVVGWIAVPNILTVHLRDEVATVLGSIR